MGSSSKDFGLGEVTMKIVKIALFITGGIVCASGYAQTSMQEQINAMKTIQSEQQTAVANAQAEKARLQRQREAAERARQSKLHAEAKAKQAQAHEEQMADKKRDQAYEDQQRQLVLESQRLDIEMKTAKIKRADDYIDQDLAREKAKTDVIQSDADAKRNVSKGAENMMTGVGEASKPKKGFFSW